MSKQQQQRDGEAVILPPHSQDAEEALIGCILIDPDSVTYVADVVRTDDFYLSRPRMAYECALKLFDGREPIDLLTMSQAMKDRGADDDGWLIGVINVVPTSINARTYAKIIADMATRRRMIQAGQRVAGLAYNLDGSLDAQLDEAETIMLAARGDRGQQGVISPRVYTTTYVNTIEQSRDGQRTVGLPTGFPSVDAILKGLEPDEQYVLAARPGMGKSAFAMNVVWHLAHKHNKRILVFSLEMGTKQLCDRIVSSATRIDGAKLRDPSLLSAEELGRVYDMTGRISDTMLYIDDSPDQTPAQIRAKSLRLYAEHGLDLVVVDHMHLMSPDRLFGNQNTEYGEISKAMKNLAKQIHAPVLTLAQLSRSVETRLNKRPVLSDLRESGRIEENASVVMFLYRDDYYDEMSERPNQAELIVAKSRNGPTGTAHLYWDRTTTSFRNLQHSEIKL